MAKGFHYSQAFKDCLDDALSSFNGQADSSSMREAVDEGRYGFVETYLRSGVHHPTQYQDPHQMRALLYVSMQERELFQLSGSRHIASEPYFG